MVWYDEYITRVEGVQGGEPIIRGTRTPVRSVVRYFEIYSGDLQNLQTGLPHLTVQQIEAALAYYRDHQAEIEADEERHTEALKGVRAV